MCSSLPWVWDVAPLPSSCSGIAAVYDNAWRLRVVLAVPWCTYHLTTVIPCLKKERQKATGCCGGVDATFSATLVLLLPAAAVIWPLLAHWHVLQAW